MSALSSIIWGLLLPQEGLGQKVERARVLKLDGVSLYQAHMELYLPMKLRHKTGVGCGKVT